MDNKNNSNKYLQIALTSISVIAAGIIIFFIVFKISSIAGFFYKLMSVLQPIVFGLVIAYIINPVMKWIEYAVTKFIGFMKKKKKLKKLSDKINTAKTARITGVAVSLILAGITVYILMYMVIPELTASISKMIEDLPIQINNFDENFRHFMKNNELMSRIDDEYILKFQETLNGFVQSSIFTNLENFTNYLTIGMKGVFNVLGVIMNFVIGIIVSIYVLCSKEIFTGQFKKIFYSLFSRRHANTIIETLRYADKVFSGFITGKLVDSMIIGILCFIGMSILKLPYTVLISVIVGVTNIIPFFGPYIGAVPSVFLILLINPIQALYFGIFLLILQQIDGNIIGPKILGNSTGLSAFWVMFAILVGGGLFGFPGMIVGVPMCAVVFYILSKITESLLEKKDLPKRSEEYINIKYIDEKSIQYIDNQSDKKGDQ